MAANAMRWMGGLGVLALVAGCPEVAATDAGDVTDATDDVDTSVDCPASCDDADPCTEDTVVGGSAEGCDLVCDHRDVSNDEDPPDDRFEDANCDGVDGERDALVFVGPGGVDDAGCGDLGTPCATIDAAILEAIAVRGDVALIEGTYDQTAVLEEGVHLYGGYAADGSRSASQVATLAPTSVQASDEGHRRVVGLVAEDLEDPTVVEYVDVAPMAPQGTPGVSVVGVLVARSPGLKLRYVQVEPGPGSPGADGANGEAGAPGQDGTGDGVADKIPPNFVRRRTGGDGGGAQTCGFDTVSGAGGRGGDGGLDDLAIVCGTNNINLPRAGGVGGFDCGAQGAAGQNPNTCPITNIYATGGGRGGDCVGAAPDATLEGPPRPWWGDADGELRWTPAAGIARTMAGMGGNGGGGGGGGGGGAGDAEACITGAPGGGGGGGGSGGCGGMPGYGGAAGGASIGLLMEDTTVTGWVQVAFAAGDGGVGGAGGAGGEGGEGGHPGLYFESGYQEASVCDVFLDDAYPQSGGSGGYGQDGGEGAGGHGGAGGLSVGAWLCDATMPDTVQTLAGRPGAGGSGGPRSVDGARGLAADRIDGCSLTPRVAVGYVIDGAGYLGVLTSVSAEWDGQGPGTFDVASATLDSCPDGMVFAGGGGATHGLWACAAPPYDTAALTVVASGRVFPNGGLSGTAFGGAWNAYGTIRPRSCESRRHLAEVNDASHTVMLCAEGVTTPPSWSGEELATWAGANVNVSVDGDVAVVEATTGDPYLTGPSGLDVHPRFSTIEIVMENATEATEGELYFRRDGDAGMSPDRRLPFAITPQSGRTTYTVQAGNHPQWDRTIAQLRLDPIAGATGTVRIVSMRLVP